MSNKLTFNSVLDEMNANQVSSEAIRFMERLRDIYAPTIEMTQLQYKFFKYYLKNYPLDLFTYEFFEVYDTDLSEKDLAQAWLHPETIKVGVKYGNSRS